MIKKFSWLISLVLLTSCGGGTTTASNGVGSGGTGSYSSGPVYGLGSIIVNGVRYDVNSAAVNTDDDTVSFGASNLQLGMLVEVKGSGITAGSSGEADSATATSVRVASDFIGPVDAVTPATGTPTSITMFGRTINIDSKTVYTSPITQGSHVVVYGLASPSGYTATRIETLSSAPAFYKISGVMRSYQPGQTPQAFGLGTETIVIGGGTNVPGGLRNGALVRARVLRTQLGGAWVAVKLSSAAPLATESLAARFNGVITELTDQQHFQVNGVSVDASALSLAGLAEGTRVELEGKMVAGTLVATEVTVRTALDIDDKEIELHGQAAVVSTGAVIEVRGVRVSYNTSIYSGPLTGSPCIEVRGKLYNSQNQLIATRIVLRSVSDCR